MPGKKVSPELQVSALSIQGMYMMDMLEGMAGDLTMESTEAMFAAMEFEKALLGIAHTLLGQAIQIYGLEQEDERIKVAERQVKLLGKL